MTIEQIEQDAIKYCDDMWGSGSTTEQEAFVAGALSRQPEIDQLTSDVERYKKDVTACFRSIRIARKIIGDKRVEIEGLKSTLAKAKVWIEQAKPFAEKYLKSVQNE